MRIRITQTCRGADDGVTVRTYAEGDEVELPETGRGRELGEVFLREGWAEPADAPRAAPEAPENASIGPAPENKGRRRR